MLLAAQTLLGGLYLAILFGLCLGAVTGAKALYILRRGAQRGPRPPEASDPPGPAGPAVPKKPKPKESDGRAVYYIVEKKRRPPKASYAKPKKIRFEEDGEPNGR